MKMNFKIRILKTVNTFNKIWEMSHILIMLRLKISAQQVNRIIKNNIRKKI